MLKKNKDKKAKNSKKWNTKWLTIKEYANKYLLHHSNRFALYYSNKVT
jgi:hypothetical protein